MMIPKKLFVSPNAVTVSVAVFFLLAAPVGGVAQSSSGQPERVQREVRIVTGETGGAIGGFGVAGAATADGSTVRFLSAGYRAMGDVVKGAPYSAETVSETVQTLADGNHIRRSNTATVNRDSEGRTRHEQKFDAIGPWATSGDAPRVVFINDPVANVHYVLRPNERTATKISAKRGGAEVNSNANSDASSNTNGNMTITTKAVENGTVEAKRFWFASKDAAGLQEPPPPPPGAVFQQRLDGPGPVGGPDVIYFGGAAGETKTEQLGKRMIEGVEAVGTRTTMTIPANSVGNELPIEVVSESWFSPELKTVVMSSRKDPRFGETTYTLRNVRLGEPLASLFEVPPDYKITDEPNVFLKVGPDSKGPDTPMRQRMLVGETK